MPKFNESDLLMAVMPSLLICHASNSASGKSVHMQLLLTWLSDESYSPSEFTATALGSSPINQHASRTSVIPCLLVNCEYGRYNT